MSYSEAIKDGFKQLLDQATASTTVRTVNCEPGIRAFKLVNRSTSEPLLYSTDGGTTYLQVFPFGKVDEYTKGTNIKIKTAESTAVYDLKVALRQ